MSKVQINQKDSINNYQLTGASKSVRFAPTLYGNPRESTAQLSQTESLDVHVAL